jgi:hypothetical protein
MKDYSEYTWQQFADEMVEKGLFTKEIADNFIAELIVKDRSPISKIGKYPISPIKSAFIWEDFDTWYELNKKFHKIHEQ